MTFQEYDAKITKAFSYGWLCFSLMMWFLRYGLGVDLETIGAFSMALIIFGVIGWLLGKAKEQQTKRDVERKLIRDCQKLLNDEAKDLGDAQQD